jgi:anti-sigma factor ChrR (cupin superfamily)
MKHELSEIELQERAFLSAIGVLTAEEQLAFERHLAEGCDLCAAELAAQQEICAALAFAAPVVEPSPTVKDKLMKRIAEEKQANSQKQTEKAGEAAKFFTLYAAEGAWQMLSEGVFVKQLYVDKDKQTVTSLYKMEPGAQAPRHIHSGVEECFVIEGDFHINDLKLGPGDYHRAEPGSVHRKIRTEKGNLLLIIAPQD